MRGDMHYTLTQIDGVREAMGASVRCALVRRYNIAPGQDAPAVIVRGGVRVCELLRWGLELGGHGHGGSRGPLVHGAPLEAIDAAPHLRDLFAKQRCLVVADGCFTWSDLKQPIWFHPEPCRPIALAGVWNADRGDAPPSFALLLGPPLVTRVNELMPIVLAARAHASWLDSLVAPEAAMRLLVSEHPLVGWRADPVSTRMTSPAHDDPGCIEPLCNPCPGEPL